MRHRLLASCAVLLIISGLAACGSSGSSTGSSNSTASSTSSAHLGPITYAGAGGSAGTAQAAEITAFEKKTGIKVNYVQGTTSTNYAKVLAEKANPQIDVVLVSSADAVAGSAQGLFAPVTEAEVPNIANLYPWTPAESDAVPAELAVEGLTYNTAKFEAAGIPPLTTTADLYNPKLKGHVALYPPNGAFGINALVLLAQANGGSATDIGPGFTALEKLKADGNWALTPETPAEGDAMLSNGTAWVEYTSTEHALPLAAQGVPLKFVAPTDTGGGVSELSYLAAAANSGQTAASMELINFLLGAGAQGTMAAQSIAPVVSDVTLSSAVAKLVPTVAQEKTALVFNPTTIAENEGEWVQDWNRDLG